MSPQTALAQAPSAEAHRYGHIQPIDTGIVQILTLFAQEPAYQGMPFVRVLEMVQTLKEGRYLACVSGGVCAGVVLYVHVSSATARTCVEENRLPRNDEVCTRGEAICMTAIAGVNTRTLARRFFAMNLGKVILYERHVRGGQFQESTSVAWVDRAGTLKGHAL